jgi:hypothetical protein
MSNKTGASINIWIGVNKNGFVSLHLEEPKRNKITGKWESNKLFCNSAIQRQLEDLIKRAQLTWENDCEFIELSLT